MSYIANQEKRFHKRKATFEIVSRISANIFDIKIKFDLPFNGINITSSDLSGESCVFSNFELADDRMSATVRVTWTATAQRPSSFLLKVRESDSLLLAESTLDQVVSPYGDITYPSGLVFALGVAKTSTPVIAGGGVPDLWTCDPTTLPAGLSFNPASGSISGTGTEDTVQSKTITATNGGGSVFGTFPIVVKPALVAVTQTIVAETGSFRNYDSLPDSKPRYVQLTFSDPIRLADDVLAKVLGAYTPTNPSSLTTFSQKNVSGNFLTDLRTSGFWRALIVSGHHSALSNMSSVNVINSGRYPENSLHSYSVLSPVRVDLTQYYSSLTIVLLENSYELDELDFRLLQGFGLDRYGRQTAATPVVKVVRVGVEA